MAYLESNSGGPQAPIHLIGNGSYWTREAPITDTSTTTHSQSQPKMIGSVVNGAGQTRLVGNSGGGGNQAKFRWTHWWWFDSCVSSPPMWWIGHSTTTTTTATTTATTSRMVSCLTASLVTLILLNVVLFAWIVSSLRLHQNQSALSLVRSGGGQWSNSAVHIDGSLRLAEDAVLYANTIVHNHHTYDRHAHQPSSEKPEHRSGLSVQSDDAGTIRLVYSNAVTDEHTDSITLTDDRIEVKTDNLVVVKTGEASGKQRVQMQLTHHELVLDHNQVTRLRSSAGGVRLAHTLNTSSVHSDAEQEFRIESRTENLKLSSGGSVQLQSVNGPIRMQASQDIMLRSSSLVLDSAKVQMSHFSEQSNQHHQHNHQHNHQPNHQQPYNRHSTHSEQMAEPIAYQLCMCGDGNVFAADVHSICEADLATCSS